MAKVAVSANGSFVVEDELKLMMMKQMLLIRLFEQAASDFYQKGLCKGGIHTCVGQEAIPVGISPHLRQEDLITSTHRGHGHHVAKGANLNKLMAELLGKATGYCKGRGGSMHVAAFDVGSLGAYPIIASGIPIAVGAALSIKLLGKDLIVISYFGDGALGQGTFYESLNLASVWRLPIVFVCENNGYAVSSKTEDLISFKTLRRLSIAYDIPCEEINGQDVLEVYTIAGQVITQTRKGDGPRIIQANTFRFQGHYVGEPEIYRPREEVERARLEHDPIILFRNKLLDEKIVTKLDLDQLEEEAQVAIQEAVRFAEVSPAPPSEEYARYVYA